MMSSPSSCKTLEEEPTADLGPAGGAQHIGGCLARVRVQTLATVVKRARAREREREREQERTLSRRSLRCRCAEPLVGGCVLVVLQHGGPCEKRGRLEDGSKGGANCRQSSAERGEGAAAPPLTSARLRWGVRGRRRWRLGLPIRSACCGWHGACQPNAAKHRAHFN
jgi:hypothetical protein